MALFFAINIIIFSAATNTLRISERKCMKRETYSSHASWAREKATRMRSGYRSRLHSYIFCRNDNAIGKKSESFAHFLVRKGGRDTAKKSAFILGIHSRKRIHASVTTKFRAITTLPKNACSLSLLSLPPFAAPAACLQAPTPSGGKKFPRLPLLSKFNVRMSEWQFLALNSQVLSRPMNTGIGIG